MSPISTVRAGKVRVNRSATLVVYETRVVSIVARWQRPVLADGRVGEMSGRAKRKGEAVRLLPEAKWEWR